MTSYTQSFFRLIIKALFFSATSAFVSSVAMNSLDRLVIVITVLLVLTAPLLTYNPADFIMLKAFSVLGGMLIIAGLPWFVKNVFSVDFSKMNIAFAFIAASVLAINILEAVVSAWLNECYMNAAAGIFVIGIMPWDRIPMFEWSEEGILSFFPLTWIAAYSFWNLGFTLVSLKLHQIDLGHVMPNYINILFIDNILMYFYGIEKWVHIRPITLACTILLPLAAQDYFDDTGAEERLIGAEFGLEIVTTLLVAIAVVGNLWTRLCPITKDGTQDTCCNCGTENCVVNVETQASIRN